MDLCQILKEVKIIAVLGISGNPVKISREIANYLILNGYKVVGVNPGKPKIEGMEVYANLSEIPYEIDLVNVFRPSDAIPSIMDDVLAKKPKYLWLQLGIRNDEAVQLAIDLGIKTVQDTCIKVAHMNCPEL